MRPLPRRKWEIGWRRSGETGTEIGYGKGDRGGIQRVKWRQSNGLITSWSSRTSSWTSTADSHMWREANVLVNELTFTKWPTLSCSWGKSHKVIPLSCAYVWPHLTQSDYSLMHLFDLTLHKVVHSLEPMKELTLHKVTNSHAHERTSLGQNDPLSRAHERTHLTQSDPLSRAHVSVFAS